MRRIGSWAVDPFTPRRWNSVFGYNVENVVIIDNEHSGSTLHLLWLLYYMKVYPTFEQAACTAAVDEKTFRKHLFLTLDRLNRDLPQVLQLPPLSRATLTWDQLRFEERWNDWTTRSPSCVADGTNFLIKEPCNLGFTSRSAFFSQKVGGPALQYVFITHVETGKFLWASDGYPGGASEARIVLNGVGERLYSNERIMADRLFRHYSETFIVSEPYDCQYTRDFDSVRSRVERQIGRLKNSSIFTNCYRGNQYQTHQQFVMVACQVVNLLY